MTARGAGAGHRDRDDAGGVWIVTGWIAGLLVYAGVVLMAMAGFTAVLPFVVVPPVLVALIGGGNLLGGRTHRSAPGGPGGATPAAGPAAGDATNATNASGVADAAGEAGSPP